MSHSYRKLISLLAVFYSKQHLEELFAKAVSLSSTAAPKDYLLNHMVCDFAETVKWWTKNQSYSPEEICHFFYETIPS